MTSSLVYIGEGVENWMDEEKDRLDGRKDIFRFVGLINLQSDGTSQGTGQQRSTSHVECSIRSHIHFGLIFFFIFLSSLFCFISQYSVNFLVLSELLR
jgi:hypothetical protein